MKHCRNIGFALLATVNALGAAAASGYSQNLDAKPLVLPAGLKFGEVYTGEVKQARSNYINGIEKKQFEAVITNQWYGFAELTIELTETKRISGIHAVRTVEDAFAQAMTNVVRLKECFTREYGLRFSGRADPSVYGDCKSWSIDGFGVEDESVHLSVSVRNGKKKHAAIFLFASSCIADRLEVKDLETEAADLRKAIKSLFGVDFDKPQRKPLWGFEWEPMKKPVEGLDEWRCSTSHSTASNYPIESLMCRHVFDGDVSREELIAAAQRVVAALEKAYGRKLPDSRKNFASQTPRGIPAAYDTQSYVNEEKYLAYGRVGTLLFSVEYAEPRYAFRNGKFELVFKGGILFSVSRIAWMK